MITLLEITLLVLVAGSVVFYLFCALCTWQFFRSKEPVLSPGESGGISVLVPVRGLEEGAWENWLSLCTQNYPNYEVLFGVTDPADPAVPLLKELAKRYSERVQLFTNLEPRGLNHKDSNLSYLLEVVQNDILVFADSDIRVSPDYLSRVTAPLADPRVGMVTCAYIGYHPQSTGAAIASIGRCFDFIPSVLIARRLDQGLRFAIGVTIAMRRSTLEAAGGLHFNRIGSDYNLGKRVAQAGYRVELSHYVLNSDTGQEGIAEVMQRELRWARTIRFNRGPIYYTMVFCYGTVYCLPLLLLAGLHPWTIAITVVTLLIRYAQALVSIFSMNCKGLIPWLWLIPLRDLLSLVVWLNGAFGQFVYWRGRRLRISGDGLLVQPDQPN
uniref:Glycosyl transferase family 2 n=1 Tax=Cyanothece sp. (strain PCC 7425 / ATCC 29141) TaxID=395961 RepID=B8HQI2_CYAP4